MTPERLMMTADEYNRKRCEYSLRCGITPHWLPTGFWSRSIDYARYCHSVLRGICHPVISLNLLKFSQKNQCFIFGTLVAQGRRIALEMMRALLVEAWQGYPRHTGAEGECLVPGHRGSASTVGPGLRPRVNGLLTTWQRRFS